METGTGRRVAPQLMLGHAKVSEVVPTILVTLLGVGFYGAHQAWSTGFFTDGFTTGMAVLLYTSILYGIVTAVSKVMTARKDLLALVDLVGTALIAGAVTWLYIAFPLNFAHFADVLPAQLRFLLSWVTNDVGRLVFGIALVASAIALLVYAIRFVLAWGQRRAFPARIA